MEFVLSPDKEVDFYKYCPLCKHENDMGDTEPCNECLHTFFNQYSHKPVKFEPKDNDRSRSV